VPSGDIGAARSAGGLYEGVTMGGAVHRYLQRGNCEQYREPNVAADG
jgi:hypothetical protein